MSIIIGTAGHVDHGKTCLVRALTGIDTDRLTEEKKRGITIELGFAYLTLPNGERAGIIDVPGHERFIKNMLAGSGGIDLAMLIVAADEGVMPQTLEHLGILSLLNVPRGIIVLTKCDLADEEWRELVKDDILENVSGTFLENAPILEVSSSTGMGLDDLRNAVFKLVEQAPPKNTSAPFRLPVDRVFTVEGFGTVITGTLIEGTLNEGDEIMLYPSMVKTRVRNIQVHSASTSSAHAGQRVAVNLQGLKKTDVARGDVIAPIGALPITMMVDVRLDVLKSTQREIKNGSRLHFYHGSREVLCKAVLLSAEELTPGSSGYAQLRLEENVSLKSGDRFVLRFYSPMETVGGGEIIDPCPKKHKRFDDDVLTALQKKEHGDTIDVVEQTILEGSSSFITIDEVMKRSAASEDDVRECVGNLLNNGSIVKIASKVYVHRGYICTLEERLTALLNDFHAKNPLKAGIKREEARTRLLPRCELGLSEAILCVLEGDGCIKARNGFVSLSSFTVKLNDDQQSLYDEIESLYKGYGLSPAALNDITISYSKSKEFGNVISALVDNGVLIRLDPQILVHECHVEMARLAAKDMGKPFALGEYRDKLNVSRKYAVALLDYFDRIKFTKKTGDLRAVISKD